MDLKKLKNILEAVLLAAERSLTVVQLETLFELDEERPTRDEIRKALHEMEDDYAERGFELKHVASGFRLQVKQEYANWVGRLWEEKPARYTRALLETMALIAYRQPITRGEIEEVRGVSVSSNIIKTLLERDWIKVLGHKDVPGKPTLYGTTKEFLDYFNLRKLDELPTLAEIKDLDAIHPELELDEDVAAKDTNSSDTDDTDTDDTGEAGSDVDAAGSDEGNQVSSDEDTEVQSSINDDEISQQETEDDPAVDDEAAVNQTSEESPAMAEEEPSEDIDTESARPAINV